MRLGVEPHVFLARAVGLFAVTFVLWSPLAPAYTQLLGTLTRWALHLTEISSDPNLHQITEIWVEGTSLFYRNRLFPQMQPPPIPAEWVQANLVLLIPLMLATPAATWGLKAARLAFALGCALVLQVFDLGLTIKAFHAYDLGQYSYHYYGDFARRVYGFADAFAQSMDTQLFPFVIWAGIHFRQLLPAAVSQRPTPKPPAAAPPPKKKGTSRSSGEAGRQTSRSA